MVILTEKEREALLILVKDFNTYYNANSLSKKLGITPTGVHKILNRLNEGGLTEMKLIGKSKIHKPKVDDEYKEKLLAFLLADEANSYKRWKEEFKELFKKGRVILMYGSAIKNYKSATDIDVMIIAKKNEFEDIRIKIKKIQELMPKRIHSIILTREEFINNLRNHNKAIVSIVKDAIVLYGQDEYIEGMKNVTGF